MVLFLDQLVACSAASGIAGRGAGGESCLFTSIFLSPRSPKVDLSQLTSFVNFEEAEIFKRGSKVVRRLGWSFPYVSPCNCFLPSRVFCHGEVADGTPQSSIPFR